MSEDTPSVDISIADRVATVSLSNPGRRNAMTSSMWRALVAASNALRDDKDVRVVILRGDGEEAFSSGADISEFSGSR